MTRLSDVLARRARVVLLLGAVVVLAAGVFGADVADRLGPYSATDPDTQSVQTIDRLAKATGLDYANTLVVLVGDDQANTSRRQFQRRVLLAQSQLLEVAGLGGVQGPVAADGSVRRPRQLSRDGNQAYIVARVRIGQRDEAVVRRVRERFVGQEDVQLGGAAAFSVVSNDIVKDDLKRAELLSFPILFVLALLFFRGLVAAALPLLVGAAATLVTYAVVKLIGEAVDLSVYALNIASALGLGLAIDWSLFMVARYREELTRAADPHRALAATMRSAGRTVLFSALTVASALSALFIFPQRFLYSMGVGGATVAVVAAMISLVLLPAMLAVLGPRVNALSPRRLQRRAAADARPAADGAWFRWAQGIVARPVPAAVVAIALLLLLAAPALGVRFTAASEADFPASLEPGQVRVALDRDFAAASLDDVVVVSSARGRQLQRLRQRIGSLDDVAATGGWQRLPSGISALSVKPSEAPLDSRSQQLVERIRRLGGGEVGVAGTSAAWVDEQASLRHHLPISLGVLAGVTLLLLFALTRSILLPVKTLLMNALSISAAFGVLVVVFQRGNGEGLLGFEAQGAIESSQPIILAAVAFGLSTDYGVFVLSRIKEARDAGATDNAAVAEGIERTGRLVTSAAALFCVAIGAIVTSQAVFIKELGLGTAVAVAIDATIVRALLVPALMTIAGRWNWWAPRLGRLRPARGRESAAS